MVLQTCLQSKISETKFFLDRIVFSFRYPVTSLNQSNWRICLCKRSIWKFMESCCWKDAALLFLRSSRSQALTWLPKGLVLISRWTTMSTPRRYNITANSRDRYGYECRCWIVLRINIPTATDPVSPRQSRSANVKYCLISLRLFRNFDGK